MSSQLLRVARGPQKSAVDQVIASLQQLKHASHGSAKLLSSAPEVLSNKDEALNIGLAISGGVDSMALASLCSQLQSDAANPNRPRFRAFVVDHGVRATSKEEANSVAKILESKNIPTSILKIQWLTDIDPKSSPKFESLARTYRFQALGRACRDHNINSLFLAHHQDDQAETLLMRLVNGHGKRGLMGMNQSAPIPECHGIYGVDRSGGDRKQLSNGEMANGAMEMESGGVMVHRPLLNFTKAQLKQHCEMNDMPWFEDHTNADPKVTMRNAIRHIYAKHTLPAALQKPSLLAMLDRLKKQKEDAAKEREEKWSRKIEIKHFDPRLPLMAIEIERLSDAEISDEKAPQMLLEVLKRTIRLISPVDDIEIKGFVPIFGPMFPYIQPQLDRPNWGEDISHMQQLLSIYERRWNKAGVQFMRDWPATPSYPFSGWTLTPSKAYRNRSPCLYIEPNSPMSLEDHIRHSDNFSLYDGRYWVNIHNQTPHKLCLRHLDSVDASKDVASHNRKLFKKVKAALGKDASKYLAVARHVLPALTVEDGEEKGRIVAFPTFGITDDEYQGTVKHVVRYKNVEDSQQ